MPNPLTASEARPSPGSPEREPLVALAGTSAHDVWVLSSARLFHWDGHRASAVTLDAEDPIVLLLTDAFGVYAATRAGRRLQAISGAWQALPDQPGPFVGAPVEAPPHPFVTLDQAIATGADSFWARGRLRALGDRFDAAPAVVRYENGVYRTWIGSPSQRTWLRMGSGDPEALRAEAFDVVVEDARYTTPVLPFVEVRWQAPRDLVRLETGEILVGTPRGLYGLTESTWTRYVATAVEALAASGEIAAALDGELRLREPGGWCPALRPELPGGESLAVAHGRAWLVSGRSLYSVDPSHAVEQWSLQLEAEHTAVDRVLTDGPDVRVFATTTDGHAITTRFDGTAWSPATVIGSETVHAAVGNTGSRTDVARFDGQCWTLLTRRPVPLVEVPAGASVRAELVGDEEAELVLRVIPPQGLHNRLANPSRGAAPEYLEAGGQDDGERTDSSRSSRRPARERPGRLLPRRDRSARLRWQDGAAPFDLFLASIATCAGIYALGYCRARQLSTEGLAVTQSMETTPFYLLLTSASPSS